MQTVKYREIMCWVICISVNENIVDSSPVFIYGIEPVSFSEQGHVTNVRVLTKYPLYSVQFQTNWPLNHFSINISNESHNPCISSTLHSIAYLKVKNIKSCFSMILIFIVLITGRVFSGICDEENNTIADMPMWVGKYPERKFINYAA